MMGNWRDRMAPYILQAVCALVGIALICAWYFIEWGPVSLISGIFFVYLAVMTVLIDLADVPGFWQPFLKHPVFGIFQIVSILGLILAAATVGILQKMGFFK